MASGDTKTEQMLDVLGNGGDASQFRGCCNTKTQSYILDAIDRVQNVEDEVEELKNNPDVVDIVDTYADLQAYDTQHLTNNDVIRVLNDETHNGESTYYRFTKSSNTWTYIGTTKQYTNFVGTDGQDAGEAGLVPAPATTDAGKFLNADGAWKNETTYAPFTGTDGQTAGTAGLVPAPATTDAGKFLKSDGTWGTAGGSTINVVQTTGTSTTDVMSQDATTKMVYPDIANKPYRMVIGEGYINSNKGVVINGRIENKALDGIAVGCTDGSPAQIGTNGRAYYSIAIGKDSVAYRGDNSVAIGSVSSCNSGQDNGNNVAIGYNTSAGMGTATSTVALGAYARTFRTGEVNIGTGGQNQGYNSTDYRVLGGVHDGVDAHDAATVGQLSYRQKKPVTVWEVDGTTVTTGLVGVGEDISANPNWQLTDLDLTPFARIKIYSRAAQKAGTTASASTTPAIILEMSLDPRAAIAEYGGNYVSSIVAQKPNDPNRLCTLCCAVSADKTKFEVLRMTNLYGTAATSNSDVNAYVFKIEGYYE